MTRESGRRLLASNHAKTKSSGSARRVAERAVDRIDLRPCFAEADAIALNDRFRGTATIDMLHAVITGRLAGDLAVVSSFGAESAVLLHLVAQIDRTIPVLFLDTGKHFAQTLAYRDALVARLGLSAVRVLAPDAAMVGASDATGLRWSWDPDGCCDIRKVWPLVRAMAGFAASITGRKGFQSRARAALPRFEVDRSDGAGRLKINPLADWTRDDIAAWFAAHDLPRHPLVARGYPSIGCAPCTSLVAPGEDPRSGRWKGWDKTECGIHRPGANDALPPAYDPIF